MRRRPETEEEIEMTNRMELTLRSIKFTTGWTQTEIARNMHVSPTVISEILNGQRVCTQKMLRIAKELDSKTKAEWLADKGEDDGIELLNENPMEIERVKMSAEDDYKVKYEELLAKYQSLVEDYQKLVNKMMGLN